MALSDDIVETVLNAGPAKKVTVYLNEDTRVHRGPLHLAVLEFLMKSGVSGATTIRGMAGFGAHHVMHTPRIELLAEHLPVWVEFVESAEKVAELMPALEALVVDGMIEVQDTTIVKIARRD
jgi:PII-like signaling protein